MKTWFASKRPSRVSVFAALSMALCFWRCDPIVISRTPSLKPVATHLTLTGFDVSPDTLEAGGTYPVSGLLESDSILTRLEFSVWDGSAGLSPESGIRVLQKGIVSGRTRWDLRTAGDIRIETDPGVSSGRYTLRATAAAGDTVRDFALEFSVLRTFEPPVPATLIGIWRADLEIATAVPSIVIHVMLQFDPGGTLLVSQRMATGLPSPFDFADISRETSAWHIEEGVVVLEKTACEYRDPETFAPTPESECRPPLTNRIPIHVSHGVWSIVEGADTTRFRKD